MNKGLEEAKKRPDFLDILLDAHKKGIFNFKQMQEQVDSFLAGGEFFLLILIENYIFRDNFDWKLHF